MDYVTIEFPEALLKKAVGKARKIKLRGQIVVGIFVRWHSEEKGEVVAVGVSYGAGAYVSERKGERVYNLYFAAPNPFLGRKDVIEYLKDSVAMDKKSGEWPYVTFPEVDIEVVR